MYISLVSSITFYLQIKKNQNMDLRNEYRYIKEYIYLTSNNLNKEKLVRLSTGSLSEEDYEELHKYPIMKFNFIYLICIYKC